MFADFTNKIRSPTKILWKGCQLRLVGLLGSRGSVMVSWVHCCHSRSTQKTQRVLQKVMELSWDAIWSTKKNRFWGSQKVQVDLAPKNPTKPLPRFSRPSSHRWLAAVFRPSHWRVPWASAPSLAAPPLVAWRRNGALGTRSRRFKKCWENLYRKFIFLKHTQLIDIKVIVDENTKRKSWWLKMIFSWSHFKGTLHIFFGTCTSRSLIVRPSGFFGMGELLENHKNSPIDRQPLRTFYHPIRVTKKNGGWLND